jgi:hypothetical protein
VKDTFFRTLKICGESSGKEDVEGSRNIKTVILKWIRGKNKQDKIRLNGRGKRL